MYYYASIKLTDYDWIFFLFDEFYLWQITQTNEMNNKNKVK